jgi:hypothetical protein
MPRAALALALAARLAPASPAAADDAAPSERRIEDARPYIIASDLLTTGMIAGGAALAYAQRDCTSHGCGLGGFYLMIFGAGGYVSWPAFIHDDAGHRGRAFASGALRVTLPLAGIAVAQVLERDTGTTLAFAGAGMVSAMLVDWLVLARRPRGADAPPLSFHAAPVDGGAVAGVSGAF